MKSFITGTRKSLTRYWMGVRSAITLTCWLGLINLSGCSQTVAPAEDEAPRHPVSGKVLLDGEPGARVVLTFIPQMGTPGLGGFAICGADGAFSATDFNNKPGLQQGRYAITFSKRVMLDGSPIPASLPEGTDTKEVLPEKVTTVNPSGHPYLIEVNAPLDSLSYELTSIK